MSEVLDPQASPADVAEEARETVFIEGYGTVYADTGELVELDGDTPEAASAPELEFTETDVEWALAKLFRLDGEIVASETRLKAELDAVTKNWKPTVNRFKGAKEGFLNWVRPQLQRYAERTLAAKNLKADGTPKANPEKSVKFPKGTLAFRSVNQVGIAAPEGGQAATNGAIEWLRKTYPGALELVPALALDKLEAEEREEIRAVVAGEKTWEEAGWPGPCPLKVTLPGDKFDVRTGVK
jgi:hypothetical protein